MDIEQFNYQLEEHLIAKVPLQNRSESKLLHVDKHTQKKTHLIFSEIEKHLTSNDVLILNNSKVIKARLLGQKESGAKIEALLLEEIAPNTFKSLLKPLKKIKEGEKIYFKEQVSAIALQKNLPFITLKFDESLHMPSILDEIGNVPLPPYIRDKKTKEEYEKEYQTVIAKNPGSIAAPTAGLHFTEALLKKLKTKGVQIETITLHVGYGTFKPIDTANIKDHEMHFETYEIEEDVAKRLTEAKKNKKRLIAVGTTSIRTLESAYKEERFISGKHKTNLYITPGYAFKAIDGLISNFHLPKSTLLVLIASFLGTEETISLYHDAIANNYRFYSFGDAMMIT